MISEKEIIINIEKDFKKIFDSVDSIKVLETYSSIKKNVSKKKPDLEIRIQTGIGSKYRVVLEVKSLGQPRYARMAVNQLKEFVSSKEDAYGVFASTFISQDSQRICKDNNIGFIDLAGNCYINFSNIYINIEGRKNPYPDTRPLKTIFNPKSSRALRVLLQNPGRTWFVRNLALEADISIGQASLIKDKLLDYEYIETIKVNNKLKFKLTGWDDLLGEWVKNYDYKKNIISNYYSLQDNKTIENDIADYLNLKGINYAFTMTSGASLVAPFLRYNRVFLYLSDSEEKLVKDLSYKKVASGPNISIMRPYDDGVLYGLQIIEEKKVVSNIQLYLDLTSYQERGEEAARFLLEEKISKKW